PRLRRSAPSRTSRPRARVDRFRCASTDRQGSRAVRRYRRSSSTTGAAGSSVTSTRTTCSADRSPRRRGSRSWPSTIVSRPSTSSRRRWTRRGRARGGASRVEAGRGSAPGASGWGGARWVLGDGSDLGIAPRRIAVGGDSAGGNLAAVVALLARDEGNTPAIALQVLVYPVTDLAGDAKSYGDFADGYLLTRDSMRWFKNHYLKSSSDADDWRASPLRAASLAGLPPALVITAGFDPLRDEGAAYAARMTEAGGLVDYICY